MPSLSWDHDPVRKRCFDTLQQGLDGIVVSGAWPAGSHEQCVGQLLILGERRFERRQLILVPAGMNDSKLGQVQIDGQAPEPVQRLGVAGAVLLYLGEEGGMLSVVLWRVRAQVGAGVFRVGRRPGQGVELVVAEHGERVALLDHGACDLQGFPLPRTTVDEVADKDHLPLRMAVDALAFDITHALEQAAQLPGLAMDIADDVVAGGGQRWTAWHWRLPSWLMGFSHPLAIVCIPAYQGNKPLLGGARATAR